MSWATEDAIIAPYALRFALCALRRKPAEWRSREAPWIACRSSAPLPLFLVPDGVAAWGEVLDADDESQTYFPLRAKR